MDLETVVIPKARAAAKAEAIAELRPRTIDKRTADQLTYTPTEDLPYSVTDTAGQVAIGVKADGSTLIGATESSTLIDAAGWAYALTDEAGNVAFGVRLDGTTTASGSGGAGEATTAGYDLILAVGQSNQSGAGRPVNAETSPTHPRIFQFPASSKPTYGTIIPAVEPLQHYGRIVGVSGAGPTMEFARQWAADHPDRKVLIIPAAQSGSSFTPGEFGSWQLNTTEPIPLGRLAIQQARDAIAAAGEGSRLVAITWVQGEGDGGMGPEMYQQHLDELFVRGFRDQVDANAPIIVGQMNPERTDSSSSAKAIDKVHMDTPRRISRTAFAYGPRGAHNANGDVTHYSIRGTTLLGRSMYEAYQRAVMNTGTLGAPQLENLRASRVGNVVTVRWDQPYGTVDGYVIEWSTNGGAWSTEGVGRYHEMDTAATITAAAPVSVRIYATNAVGNGNPQTITA